MSRPNKLPGVPEFDPQLAPQTQLARAIEGNVRWTMSRIANSPEGQARLAEGWMKIVGAVNKIESGGVRFLSDEATRSPTRRRLAP
jgi:carbonic anhydrase